MAKTKPKTKKSSEKIIEDNIFITGKQTGFIRVPQDNDIEIKTDHLNTALHNDLVKVAISNHVARVIEIVKRAKTKFVGTLKQDQTGNFYLIPDDFKFYPHLDVRHSSEKNFKFDEKTKVLVEMLPWTNPRQNPQGKLLEILGKKGDNNVEMESILYEKGFRPNFPQEVEAEADKIKSNSHKDFSKVIKKRRDFRDRVTFTIDPDNAKDFDDALSFKKLENGNIEVGIHIADVTHYVKINSLIDKEATRRCTSVYLVDRTIPMLPEVLSNDLCSLNPNEDKLSFSAVFVLDKQTNIIEEWFGETIINSNKRFTYKNAQAILDKKQGEFYEELKTLDGLAQIMRRKRIQHGAITFSSNEYKFQLDENGRAIAVEEKEILETNELIEDFMLLANQRIAHYIGRKEKELKIKLPFVYRVHDYPKPDQIKELIEFLKTIGYHLKLKNNKVPSQNLNNLLAKIEGTPEENLIATAMLKSMAKAIYSVKNIGHYGLAFKYYTHFTSPIRRYPDMMVHRLMKKYLANDSLSPRSIKKYKELTLKSTQQEIAATIAERDSKKYKFVELMSQKIGQEFKAVISGITKWGVYVQANNGADGMISLHSLKDDFYELDAKNYRLIGQKNKRTYTLGDEIRVKLVKTDIDKRLIDFELAV